MNYSETYFELDSEEATHCDHCHLICCVYIKGHVKMVNTKDQRNAIVYWDWYLVCRHCRYKDQSMQCIQCYLCWHCRYKTHPHISAHNFLNIQWIFNLQKVLESWESWDSGLVKTHPHIPIINTNICWKLTVVNHTSQGSLMHSMLSMSIQNTPTHSCQ